MQAFLFRVGEFSHLNDEIQNQLRTHFPEHDWRIVDIERDIVGRDPVLRTRATAEALLRYGGRILRQRQPPRDYFCRLPVVLEAIRAWVRQHVDPARTAFTFQTQSLFDAAHPGLPHFLYTDHTYLANLRYPTPKPLLPVPAAWRRMERDLYHRAACTFVTSEFAATSVRDDYGVPAPRVACVFSGENVRATASRARRDNVILFVGVDWERKGGPELVAAFREVRARRPDAELWVVGCSPAIDEPGIRVVGRVPREEVARFYAEATVFCLPSRVDPSAGVLAEAALAGLPVVATPVGGNGERVRHGETGFLASPAELAPRLLELLLDRELRDRLGKAGQAFARQHFTWEAVAAKLVARIRQET